MYRSFSQLKRLNHLRSILPQCLDRQRFQLKLSWDIISFMTNGKVLFNMRVSGLRGEDVGFITTTQRRQV